MSIFYVPDTVVTGAEDDSVEVVVDEVALLEASSCRTAKDTLALRSSRDTVTVLELPPTLVELPWEAMIQRRTSRSLTLAVKHEDTKLQRLEVRVRMAAAADCTQFLSSACAGYTMRVYGSSSLGGACGAWACLFH